jgi:hypothetical protein
MRHKVDFQFTKNWGLIEKGTVKSFKKPQAKSLQNIHKVGKIIGETKSKAELNDMEAVKAEIDQAAEERVVAVKNELKGKEEFHAKEKSLAESAMKAQKDKHAAEIKAMKDKHTESEKALKAKLAESNKEKVQAEKALKVSNNKLEKLAQQRATK